jgi:hypothetical protein
MRQKARILYLALADARGHLMRAHLLQKLLAPRGIAVDILTTSREGQAFLAALGTPSEVLSEHFKVAFDGCHDMSKSRTDRCVARYFLSPRRGLKDLAKIGRRARGADLVINDSLHPALLLAPFVPGPRMRVVHVFGENIWAAAEQNFAGRAPAWWQRLYTWGIRKMRDAAFACIMHTLSAPDQKGLSRTIRVAPIVAAPARSQVEARAALGVLPGQRLAAVYLNPHFTDPRVAAALEAALGRAGYAVHAVGEGYAARQGWVARDGDLASVVRAADLFVSGAGMGALGQAQVFGTPLLALLGDQPEQIRNAESAVRASNAFAKVVLTPDLADLERDLDAAIARLSHPRIRRTTDGVGAVHEQWADAFFRLINEARKEDHREIIVNSTGFGNEQPAERVQQRVHPSDARARRSGGAPRASRAANLFAPRAERAGDHA